eukprot:269300-Pelagomonas_calceolata.AAC.4
MHSNRQASLCTDSMHKSLGRASREQSHEADSTSRALRKPTAPEGVRGHPFQTQWHGQHEPTQTSLTANKYEKSFLACSALLLRFIGAPGVLTQQGGSGGVEVQMKSR